MKVKQGTTATYFPFTASDDVRSAIDRLGRTEDLLFSPDNSRLAIAGMIENKILILDIEIKSERRECAVLMTDYLEITSAAFSHPHGLFWIDNQTLIVANRNGEVPILEIPTAKPKSKVAEVTPLETIRANSTDMLQSPGSVSVSKIGMDLHEVLVCNNYAHYVTRHILDQRNDFSVKGSAKLLSEGLDIPDSVAHSHCGRWIAVSNHNWHNVFLYENTSALNPSCKPSGTLEGINYPHGVRFTSDNRYILVADAGAPFIHVYASEDDNWSGQRHPVQTIRVMDDDIFSRGQANPQEGGPKGIALSDDNNILVASCEEQPIVFIDLKETLQVLDKQFPKSARPSRSAGQAERTRTVLLSYLDGLIQTNAHAQIELESSRKTLAIVEETHSEMKMLAEIREIEIQRLLDKTLDSKLRRIGSTIRSFLKFQKLSAKVKFLKH